MAEPLIENVSLKPFAGAAFSTFVHLKRSASALIKTPFTMKVPETATSSVRRSFPTISMPGLPLSPNSIINPFVIVAAVPPVMYDTMSGLTSNPSMRAAATPENVIRFFAES